MPKTKAEREAERQRAKDGIKARRDAISTLIARHQEEFNQLVTANRVALGLPLKPQGPTKAQLEERIAREEEKLRKWREELAAVA